MLFNSFHDIRDQAVTTSNYSNYQEIESENYCIHFRYCTHRHNINIKFNSFIIFFSVQFNLGLKFVFTTCFCLIFPLLTFSCLYMFTNFTLRAMSSLSIGDAYFACLHFSVGMLCFH